MTTNVSRTEMSLELEQSGKPEGSSLLKDQGGYLLVLVAMIGVLLAILLGYILPQLHTGQMVSATTNLNEYRAQEAARKGINAVNLGLQDLNNFQELLGYSISGVTTADKQFAIYGNYAALFSSGVSVAVRCSAGNDGIYTVSGATNYSSGTTRTEIAVLETISSGTTQGVISRNMGLFWAVEQLCGTPSSPKHDEYVDLSGNTQFVSNCLGINLGGNELGSLDMIILVSRNGVISGTTPDGNPRNDGWYFYHSGVTGPNGTPWLSPDNWPATPTVNYFEYVDGSIRYYDFDMVGTLDGTTYDKQADVKCERGAIDKKWRIAVGNDGSWRGTYTGTQLWNLQKDFTSGTTPFQDVDNDADGDVDANDDVEVFIIVRSRGITVAPGSSYATDKTSLKLIRDVAGSHLPNPMPQVLEAGFYLPEYPR